ncbi:MAG TPA: cation diffusion facilitator family transporter, partial [Enhygromyxa sp.]|nr:cation diffusion facilitator family transporter [Enhygromyxa sp.]
MDATQRQQLITRTHRLGVIANAGLAALKLTVGGLAGSRALIADGVHSLSDVVMNAGAWIGWRWATRPPDRDHHYGHGNIEALTTLLVGLTIVAAGAGLIWTALHGHSTVTADALGFAAVATELVSIAVKLGLARVTGRRGRELDSSILIAIARDNASDVLTSALIMLAIVGAIVGLRWLEPTAAIAIGLLIGWQGLRSAYEGIGVLMDRAPDHELTAEVAQVASEVAGVVSVDEVRVHPLGTHLRVDMQISVDGRIAVVEGHAIAHAVVDAVVGRCRR